MGKKTRLCACSFGRAGSDLRREYLKLRRPVLNARVLVEKVLVSDSKSGGPDRCRPPPTQQHSIKGRLLTVLYVRHTETSVLYSHAGASRSFCFVGHVLKRVTSVVTGAGRGGGLLKKKPVQAEKKSPFFLQRNLAEAILPSPSQCFLVSLFSQLQVKGRRGDWGFEATVMSLFSPNWLGRAPNSVLIVSLKPLSGDPTS